jgi:hypothetical protein
VAERTPPDSCLSLLLLAIGIGGQRVSRATSYPTITAAAIGTHIAAIQGPRSGTGNQANLAKLNEVADYVHGQLLAGGLAVSEAPVTFGGQTFPNIVGTLPGTTCPEKTFIVGAHYDGSSSGPAADDDASGVAGMLEIADALSSRPLPASVDFAAFAFEEAGLIGSRQMAQTAASTGKEIIGMFSLEMIGYTCDEPGCQSYPAGMEPTRETGDFLSVVGNTASAGLLNHFMESSAAAGPDLIVFVTGSPGKWRIASRRSSQRSRAFLGQRLSGASGQRHRRPAKPELPSADRHPGHARPPVRCRRDECVSRDSRRGTDSGCQRRWSR